jgi:hypothetical protein
LPRRFRYRRHFARHVHNLHGKRGGSRLYRMHKQRRERGRLQVVDDGEDEIANLQSVRIAKRQRGQIFCLHPDDRDIRTGVGSDALCRRLASIGESYDDVVRTAYHMIIGEDQSFSASMITPEPVAFA